MIQRKKLFVTIALLVGAGVLGAFLLMPCQPRYQGRSLNVWLSDLRSEQPGRQALAADAIRHLGGKALPKIIEDLKLPRPGTRKDSLESKWKRRFLELLSKQSLIKIPAGRPLDPRHNALAGLDVLGPAATSALPALENLLRENPPDPRALYVVARIGNTGTPLLNRSLTNEVKLLRLEAGVCLEMVKLHSETMFPNATSGADFPSFDRRMCEFNLKVLQAAAQDYRTMHPDDFSDLPMDPPSAYDNSAVGTVIPKSSTNKISHSTPNKGGAIERSEPPR